MSSIPVVPCLNIIIIIYCLPLRGFCRAVLYLNMSTCGMCFSEMLFYGTVSTICSK